MPTKTIENTELVSVKQEVKTLRSLILMLVPTEHDSEGEYHPGFVKRILRAKKEKPVSAFVDGKSFLAQIAKQKS